MIRVTAVPALIAVAAAVLLMPATSAADDRQYYGDRDRGYSDGYRDRHAEHEYREHRRHDEREWREQERREHEWREHERRERREGSRGGYYDRFGYWHPYRY